MISPDLIEDLAKALNNALDHLAVLNSRIDDLHHQGAINASVYYRNGRYLYLIYPTAPDGTRKREYIGSDPAKIANSKTAIDRYKTLCKLIDARDIRQRTLAYVIASIKTSIHSLAGAL